MNEIGTLNALPPMEVGQLFHQTMRPLARIRDKLPPFDCPNPLCRAKRIFFAGNTDVRNTAAVSLYDPQRPSDLVMICPKCGRRIAVTLKQR